MENKNVHEVIEKLDSLKRLLDLGVIDEEEYEKKKAEVLRSEVLPAAEEAEVISAPKAVSRGIPEEPAKVKKKGQRRKGLVFGIIAGALVLVLAALFLIPSTGFRCMIVGHVPSDFMIEKMPSCSEDGSSISVCEVCGKTISTRTISKTGIHSYSNGVCTVCGAKDPNYNTNQASFKARTLVEIHVRKGPGLSYEVIRTLGYNSTVTVYETKKADGYTWNRIGNNEWIANDGTWLQVIN